MKAQQTVSFDQADLLACLEASDDRELDTLDFGVIGFTDDTVVCRYNAFESQAAKIAPEKVLGHPLFTDVAQCMNNFLVAQCFQDAREERTVLDSTIDYVLTWKFRPTPVKLRMLSSPQHATQYVVLLHSLT
jgi:photoactive yellow protein